jgi:chromosome partitioning protein
MPLPVFAGAQDVSVKTGQNAEAAFRSGRFSQDKGIPMLVVAMASQKGGSGKTTLAGHLAVEAEAAGAGPVALIDTDPQGSLAHWWNSREGNTPLFAKVSVFDLQEALNHLRANGIKLVVIDTPPAITASISHVIAHADLVVVPTRPSPHDLRAVGATVDMAERHGKPLIFVVNAATLRARITGEAAVSLSQHGTVAPVTIHHRVDFAASMVDGRTVGEVVPKSASAKEVSDLWLYIQDRLARAKKEAGLAPETRPEHFATGSLSALDASEQQGAEERAVEEQAGAEEFMTAAEKPAPEPRPAPPPVKPFEEIERRPSVRPHAPATALFSGVERPFGRFGRRQSDNYR